MAKIGMGIQIAHEGASAIVAASPEMGWVLGTRKAGCAQDIPLHINQAEHLTSLHGASTTEPGGSLRIAQPPLSNEHNGI
jgi:hypothetical protein